MAIHQPFGQLLGRDKIPAPQGRFGLMLYLFTETEWTNHTGEFVRRRISTSIRY